MEQERSPGMTPEQDAAITTVLSQLLKKILEGDGMPERINIQMADATQFPYRLHYAGDAEYVGGVIILDES